MLVEDEQDGGSIPPTSTNKKTQRNLGYFFNTNQRYYLIFS